MTTGEEAAQTGLQYEGEIWRQVLHRLDRRGARRPGDPAYAYTHVVTKERPKEDAPDPELDDLRNIVKMRRTMAESLASFSETYRDEIWENLQTKIEADNDDKQGWFAFLRRPSSTSPEKARTHQPASDADPGTDDLLAVAQARRNLGRRSSDLAEESREDVWQRIRNEILEQEMLRHNRGSGRAIRRWALAAAAAALVVAALGPIPATGFANHPAVEAVRFAGQQLGVVEAESPPALTVADRIVAPVDATPAEAADMLGFFVTEPAAVPGFELTSSRVFPVAITADDGGMFVLAYEGNDAGSLVIYQESASGGDLAIGPGSATMITLSDGTEATYVDGSWAMAGAAPAWEAGETQTIVFDRAGVRTIVRYTGPAVDQANLISIAELI